MKSIPFNPETDIAPIQFDKNLLSAADRLRKAGLRWEPHVGCFVWDCNGMIQPPSPFPLDIYFVLSLPRFIEIFGSIEEIRRHLIWVPTWDQVISLCRRMDDQQILLKEILDFEKNPELDLVYAYDQLSEFLEHQGQRYSDEV